MSEGEFDVVGSSTATFSVEVAKVNNYQTVLFSSSDYEHLLLMGLYDPEKDAVIANDTTTALALCMLNPLLIHAGYEELTDYFEALKESEGLGLILDHIANVHQTEPNILFDRELNPQLFELAYQASEEIMEHLADDGKLLNDNADNGMPAIDDADGVAISFVNPDHLWYGVAIYTIIEDTLKDLTQVRPAIGLEYAWGWPPSVEYREQATNYDLGNGYFRIELNSGYDLNEFSSANAKGMGTRLNTIQALKYMIKLGVGQEPVIDFSGIYNMVTEEHIEAFDSASDQKNVPQLVSAFSDLFIDNSENVALWLWPNKPDSSGDAYLAVTGLIIRNIISEFDMAGLSDIEVPFFYDLINSNKDITYTLLQENGTIVSIAY